MSFSTFKLISKMVVYIAAIGVGGCYSFTTARLNDTIPTSAYTPEGTIRRPVEHVVISNYGWYLFNAIPLICGNAHDRNDAYWAIGRDDVNVEVLQQRLVNYANQRGCDVTDQSFFCDETVLLYIYGIPIPIPYLCCRHSLQISANLVKARVGDWGVR